MQKIMMIAIALTIAAIAANADTTYVCSQVGDWDIFGIRYVDQVSLVQANIAMEVTLFDDDTWQISSTVNGNQVPVCNRVVQVCKRGCTSGEVQSGKCLCYYCVGSSKEYIEMVEDIVELLLQVYGS